MWPYLLPADRADKVSSCILSLLCLLDGLLLRSLWVWLMGGVVLLWWERRPLSRCNSMKLALKLPTHLKQMGDTHISYFVILRSYQ